MVASAAGGMALVIFLLTLWFDELSRNVCFPQQTTAFEREGQDFGIFISLPGSALFPASERTPLLLP